eukprot:jgi/Picsp_1/6370/NSC_03719-R1_histone deacetylase 1
MTDRKRKIAYFYDGDYAGMYYGADHPMKPPRIAMAHSLIIGYGLHEKMDVYRPRRAQSDELVSFHSEEYVEIMRSTQPEVFRSSMPKYSRFGLDEDCPIFPGLFDFSRLSSGASIDGAAKLNSGHYDIAVNWAGGLHHAKKSSASGFCYFNDCVLGILELLKVHPRVLYIDIDIHHGDGVEEAFYCTDRVMTLSTHMYRPEWFFPGTGSLDEIGEGQGRGYAINVPLLEGCTDEDFMFMFKPILEKIISVFSPGAIVLQCGADGLVGDRLGSFNMTVEGHAKAVELVRSYNIPTLVLGGGGYTKTNVARAWTLDTAALAGVDLEDEIPESDYYSYFAPETSIRYNPAPRFSDFNTREELQRIRAAILDNLSTLHSAPGAHLEFHPPESFVPHAPIGQDDEESIHNRLSLYAQTHFSHYLKCVEAGSIDPFEEL